MISQPQKQKTPTHTLNKFNLLKARGYSLPFLLLAHLNLIYTAKYLYFLICCMLFSVSNKRYYVAHCLDSPSGDGQTKPFWEISAISFLIGNRFYMER